MRRSSPRGSLSATIEQSSRGFDSTPVRRLVRIELRKALNTRAGAGILATMSAMSLLIMGAVALWGGEDGQSFGNYFDLATLPLMFLLPIVGIMLTTQEWTTRSGLMTFAFEPKRERVIVAKLIASALLGVFVVATAFVAAGVLTVATGGRWTFEGISVAGAALALTLLVLQGAAFGLALLNTTLAIVLSLLLPVTWSLVTPLIPSLSEAAGWLELHQPLLQLATGAMSPQAWSQLVVVSLTWIALPLSVGTLRVLRGEIT